jgi:ATP-dependent Zn protease
VQLRFLPTALLIWGWFMMMRGMGGSSGGSGGISNIFRIGRSNAKKVNKEQVRVPSTHTYLLTYLHTYIHAYILRW